MSAKILIADDEPNVRLVLKAALETDGHTVLVAHDGRNALDLVARERPDLLLLDLNMPVMDGHAVLARLRERADPDDPVVLVLTAHATIAAAVDATRLGAADFLQKPITPEPLRKAVNDALALRRVRRMQTQTIDT